MKLINMIVFVFILGIVIVNAAIPPHVQNYWKESHEECKKSSQIDDQMLQQARNGTILIDNESLGKHILCIALKFGTIVKYDSAQRKDDIKLNEEGLMKHFEHQPHVTQDLVKSTIETCDKENDDNIYIKMNKIANCFVKGVKNAQW